MSSDAPSWSEGKYMGDNKSRQNPAHFSPPQQPLASQYSCTYPVGKMRKKSPSTFCSPIPSLYPVSNLQIDKQVWSSLVDRWFLIFICQQTNTKDIAGQSARSRCQQEHDWGEICQGSNEAWTAQVEILWRMILIRSTHLSPSWGAFNWFWFEDKTTFNWFWFEDKTTFNWFWFV